MDILLDNWEWVLVGFFVNIKEKFLIAYYTKVTTLFEVVPASTLTIVITSQKLLLNLPLNKGKQKVNWNPQYT